MSEEEELDDELDESESDPDELEDEPDDDDASQKRDFCASA